MIPIRVDIAPFATLLDVLTGAPIDWVDVSCRVSRTAGISMKRGRSGQSEVSGTGSLSFTLDNGDGAFTPGRGLSLAAFIAAETGWVVPFGWAPELRDMPVRVTYGIPAGSTQALWAGVITGVRVEWRNGMLGRAKVTAADAVSHLNRITMRQLPVAVTLMYDPVGMYALDEDGGEHAYPATLSGPALALDSVGSGFAPSGFEWSQGASPGSAPHLKEAGAPLWSDSAATRGWRLEAYDPLNGLPQIVPYDPLVPGGVGTVHAMILPGDPGRTMTAVSWEAPSGMDLEFGVSSTTVPFVRVGTSTVSGSTITPGVWHHVAATLQYDILTGTAVELFVDGVSVAASTVPDGATGFGARRWRVGASSATWVPECWEGRIANVAAHGTILADGVIAEIAAGRDGWTGDTATVRGLRVARAAFGAPDLPDMTDVGMSTMCPSHTRDKTAGSVLNDIAATEQSGWWTVRAGFLRVGSRAARWGAPVALTLDASTVDAGLSFEADNDNRTTDVHVQRPGWSHVARRSTHAGDGLIYQHDVTLWVDSDPQLEAYADWAISAPRSEPGPRSETVSIDVERMAADINEATVLATDIDDVIEVDGLPYNAPADSLRLLVVGVSDDVTVSGWRRTFNVTPAEQYRQFWTLDVSELDVDTYPAP